MSGRDGGATIVALGATDALRELVENAGHRLIAADDEGSAFEIALRESAEVVIVGGAAADVATFGRRLAAPPDAAAGVVIGPPDPAAAAAALDAGASDYVALPWHAAELRARIAHQVRSVRSRRELLTRATELQADNERRREAQQATRREFTNLHGVLAGAVLDGKYRLDEAIGSGDFGTVFRGQHLHLGRAVAIKVFRPSPGNDTPEALARFRSEGATASRLHHPNVVSVYDCGVTEGGIAYLVMELLEGRTLADEMEGSAALPLERCAQVLTPVCEALAAMHAAGLVYRDVRPENIFLHQSPREVVKVLDFGVAKVLMKEGSEESPLSRGIVVGVPAYVAPERLRGGSYDGRADVYGVGVLLYKMLSGRLPFAPRPKDGPLDAALRAFKEPPPPLQDADVPPEVERMIVQALSPDPARRPTARELGEALAVWR